MPELAEVEFYRKQWTCGVRQTIRSVELHAQKRIFRGTNTALLCQSLNGAKLLDSHSHGKQMLFEFTNDAWLGIHLGMTGKLRVEAADFKPTKHDHLVLHQSRQSLVFSDPRLFGRVLFYHGKQQPSWWIDLPPHLFSREYKMPRFEQFLQRHGKAPIKAVLLMQQGFPGIGNWMADEILWQAGVHPRMPSGQLNHSERKQLWHSLRGVSRKAMETVGEDFSDPPKGWLFHRRWGRGAHCPRCSEMLLTETVGGRTTCWCPRCQQMSQETRPTAERAAS